MVEWEFNKGVMMELTFISEENCSYKENNNSKGSDPYKMDSFNCSLSFSSFILLSVLPDFKSRLKFHEKK
jgi:hypothetical protein